MDMGSTPTSRWFYTPRRERISGRLFFDAGGSNESQVSNTRRSARELVSNTTMCCRMCHTSEQHGAAPLEPCNRGMNTGPNSVRNVFSGEYCSASDELHPPLRQTLSFSIF